MRITRFQNYRRDPRLLLPMVFCLVGVLISGHASGGLNGDGDLDVIFAVFNDPNKVCLGDGNGSLVCSDVNSERRLSTVVGLGDVNNDGDLDLVFTNQDEMNQACWGNGTGAMDCVNVSADERASWDVALGDLNADGRLDSVFANQIHTDQVCLGDGEGDFSCSNVSEDSSPQRLGVVLASGFQTPSMTISKTSTTRLITAAGQVVSYIYVLRNTGSPAPQPRCISSGINLLMTSLISADVVVLPRLKRTAPAPTSGEIPIACNTDDNSTRPEWQAEPVEAASSGIWARSSLPV